MALVRAPARPMQLRVLDENGRLVDACVLARAARKDMPNAAEASAAADLAVLAIAGDRVVIKAGRGDAAAIGSWAGPALSRYRVPHGRSMSRPRRRRLCHAIVRPTDDPRHGHSVDATEATD